MSPILVTRPQVRKARAVAQSLIIKRSMHAIVHSFFS
jgi:hypothetical protein